MDANNSIMRDYDHSYDNYKLLCSKMKLLLEELMKARSIDYQFVEYRVKDRNSLQEKLLRKEGKYFSIKDITDIIGVRIITEYDDTLDEIVKLIREEFEVDEENSLDKREELEPDQFGYLSIHYIVCLKEPRVNLPEYDPYKSIKVEIQLRTVLQHAWAAIQHKLGYKSKDETPREIKRLFARLASTLEGVDQEFIRIRDALKKYVDKVDRDGISGSAESFIDDITLSAFIKTNPRYIDFLHQFNPSFTPRHADTTKNMLLDIIKKLKFIDISTINALDAAFQKYFHLTLELANNRFNSDKGISKELTGIFYLIYVIAGKEHSQEKFKAFLDTFYPAYREKETFISDTISFINNIEIQ